MSKYLSKELLERHLSIPDEIDNFIDNISDPIEKQCYVKLLEANSMTRYQLFKASNSAEGVLCLLINLHHALVDDGELSIVKVVDRNATDLNKRLGISSVAYKYELSCSSEDGAPINAWQLLKIIKLIQKSDYYYKANTDAIEDGGSPEEDCWWCMTWDYKAYLEGIYKKWEKSYE